MKWLQVHGRIPISIPSITLSRTCCVTSTNYDISNASLEPSWTWSALSAGLKFRCFPFEPFEAIVLWVHVMSLTFGLFTSLGPRFDVLLFYSILW